MKDSGFAKELTYDEEQDEIGRILSRPYASVAVKVEVVRKVGYAEKRAEYERQAAMICLECRNPHCPGGCAKFRRLANGIYRNVYGHKAKKIY